MLAIDAVLLETIGLGDLRDDQAERAMARIRSLLDLRIGLRLANELSDAQLEAFLREVRLQGPVPAYEYLLGIRPDCIAFLYEEAAALRAELPQLAGLIRRAECD